MQASNVTITPQTMERMSMPLGKSERARLREQKLIEFIESRPYMQHINHKELGDWLHMESGSVGWFLYDKVKKGLITRHDLGLRRAAYTVNTPVKKTHQVPTYNFQKHTESAPPPPSEASYWSQASSDKIARLAQQFFWETQSNDLHEFIEWINKQT